MSEFLHFGGGSGAEAEGLTRSIFDRSQINNCYELQEAIDAYRGLSSPEAAKETELQADLNLFRVSVAVLLGQARAMSKKQGWAVFRQPREDTSGLLGPKETLVYLVRPKPDPSRSARAIFPYPRVRIITNQKVKEAPSKYITRQFSADPDNNINTFPSVYDENEPGLEPHAVRFWVDDRGRLRHHNMEKYDMMGPMIAASEPGVAEVYPFCAPESQADQIAALNTGWGLLEEVSQLVPVHTNKYN